MKKNLAELQQQMRERQLNVDKNVPLPTEEVSNQPLCAHCKRRVCRAGSALCSRCTGKGIVQELRDTLPGLEVKREILPLRETRNVTGPVNPPVSDTNVGNVYQHPTSATTFIGVDLGAGKDKTAITRVTYYTRREVSELVGVSPTSICRWEQKGKVLPPLRIAHSGQLLYTQEHIDKIKEYMSQIVIVQNTPKLATQDGQQHVAAKIATKKVFKINKGMERAVATRLGRLSFPLGKR